MRDRCRTVVPLLFALVVMLCGATAAQESRFGATVDVARVLTDVRVVRADGQPVLGLTANDFTVRIGDQEVEVESVRWVAAEKLAALPDDQATAARVTTVPGDPTLVAAASSEAGRRIVLLFQLGFERTRMSGLYRMSRQARAMVDELTVAATDRVAIAVYNSHLQLHVDFTADRELLRRELGIIELVKDKRAEAAQVEPSLVATFDFERGKNASTLEKGLQTLGDALRPIQGAKSVAMFGWGIGRFSMGHVVLTKDYDRARNALIDAHTSVFAMDVTTAESHSLQAGLQTLAVETGGFYAKTHEFPRLAMRRLNSALVGYYELTLVRPDDLAGLYSVAVSVATPGVTVLARPVSL